MPGFLTTVLTAPTMVAGCPPVRCQVAWPATETGSWWPIPFLCAFVARGTGVVREGDGVGQAQRLDIRGDGVGQAQRIDIRGDGVAVIIRGELFTTC
ncbi:MAG: hypothetical protein EBT00_13510 [Proteobacteria bacterium]|nr:hypothetical protein [Pseudomonadota bacterium]NBX47267.1 hypothetical protein [Chloroflexota bacterium]